MALNKYLKEIRKFAPLTKEEEKELFKKAKSGDRKAYELIIESNLRFVVSVAKKYQNQGIDLEELIAEGNIGLMRAYERFDVNKNYKFITYAVWWIRQAILTSIHENSKLIRLPLNKITNITKANKLKEQIEQEFARPLGYSELALYIDDPEILDDLKYNHVTINLDQPQTDNDQDLNSILPDIDAFIIGHLEVFEDELNDILRSYTKREQDIIKMYFGIGHIRAYTLKEIGIDLGLTRERIRQIKEKVIAQLRDGNRADDLRSYLK